MSTPFDVRRWASQAGIQTTGGFAVIAECVTMDELERFAHIAISSAAKSWQQADRIASELQDTCHKQAQRIAALEQAARQALAQQKPVAHLPCCGYTDTSALQWNPYNGVAQCHNCGQVYTAPQPTENLHCKSTQKRLATLWGYVKKEPDHFRDATQMVPTRQPLTDAQVKEMGRKHSAEDLCRWSYSMGIKDAEAAHGITGGQQ